MERFTGQVAIITGGADGLGKGIARRLAEEGCSVVLWDRNERLLDRTLQEFQSEGLTAAARVVDIGEEGQVRSCMEEVGRSFGQVDVMVNAAGIVGPTNRKITDYSTGEFDAIYRINLRGAFLVTRYVLPFMEKREYGRILLLASIAGKEGNPYMCGYSAMKAGVIGLVKGIGKEYAEAGITVNGLAPAVIRTAMNADTDPEQLAYMTARIPMKRLGTVQEVASLAAWIVSPEASFNTGVIFDLSGGRATY